MTENPAIADGQLADAGSAGRGGGPTHSPERVTGLDQREAARRLQTDGPNEIASQGPRTGLRIAVEVVREPMLALLVAAGILYVLLGEARDAWTLLGFVGLVLTITIVQERRTERALATLRDLSSPRACVVRDGQRMRIAGREVVRGDIVVLSEGDRVPADAILRSGLNLAVDESLLTGESAPVRKGASATATMLERPGGDELASVFAGTLVTSGHGMGEVVATGEHSELGKIGSSLAETQLEATRLQKDTRRIVRWFALAGIVLSVAITCTYAISRGGSATTWKEGLLAGIAAAMSLLPEEFAVVVTVYLAIGAWRIAREGVLARRMPAVESLGETTVLCTDKTGTLTENRMTLAVLSSSKSSVASEVGPTLPDELHGLLATAVLASKRDAFDPMERAIHAAADRWLAPSGLSAGRSLEREYPLAPELLAVTRAWTRADSTSVEIASKGAPESIAKLCRLTPRERDLLLAEAGRLAAGGLRVLGVARGAIAASELPLEHAALRLELVGLLGFEDPLRETVPAAIAQCRRAGIRVVMITGDHLATARSIADRAGIPLSASALGGDEMAAMTDAELAQRIETTGVFARIAPQQKLRIVRAFVARGDVVAMIGDGVNDAPALRAAHIGVAMGGRGTDVAREAAGLVLVSDEFSALVGAIRSGRRIYDNIQTAMVFIIAVHVPIAALTLGQALVPSAPLLLLPVHLAFLELVIDPACSLVFEAEPAELGIMDRPPRRADQPLLSRAIIVFAALQGCIALGVCGAVLLFVHRGHPPDVARAVAFTTLVVAIVVLMLANRSTKRTDRTSARKTNRALWAVLGATMATLSCVLFVPAIQRLFSFAPLEMEDLALAVAAGLSCWVWLEVWKRVRRAVAGRHGRTQ